MRARLQSPDVNPSELPVPDQYRRVRANAPAGQPYNVARMWRRFASAILGGRAVDPDFNTAKQRHKLLDAIQRGSDTGQRQNV